jgi:hypothetical protein
LEELNMPKLPSRRWFAPSLPIAVLTLAAAGCEERVGQPAPPPPAPERTVIEGAGSAAGKAVESGQNLEKQVGEHNKALEKQIEEIGKD